MQLFCIFCESAILGSGKKYCSLSCSNRGRPNKGVTEHERTCPTCATIFFVTGATIHQKFCSRSCAAVLNNSDRKKTYAPCTECGKSLKKKSKMEYCSWSCREKSHTKLWLLGELDGNRTYDCATYVRRYVVDRAEDKCEICGFNEKRTNGSGVLQLDHIDGNWQNNRPENLRLLCPNCHALTDNYGAANMGNGRTWKKKYNQFQKIDNSIRDL